MNTGGGIRALLAAALCAACVATATGQTGRGDLPGQVRTEIRYRDGTVVLRSDTQEKSQSLHRAAGRVHITFRDIVVTGDEAVYDEATREGFISGNTRFSQDGDRQWLSASRAEFNFATQTGAFYDATGFTDREFMISGRRILKTGPDTYRVEEGGATTCPEENPKWRFTAGRTDIRVDRTARMQNAVFRIKGVPVLYLPYVVLPVGMKERSSGFLPFHTGSSTSKGRVFSEGYYQTLGRSADLLLYGDYFSLRGLALGAEFRARPNQKTRLEIRGYGIRDRLDQGGAQLDIDGESWLGEDWRAVARANISSSFTFRQAFSENLRTATIPMEKAQGFLSRNHQSLSTNIVFSREAVTFPGESVVVRRIPSLQFLSLGAPLGRSPFFLSFRSALEGLSRLDSLLETGGIVQRMDIFPRITARIPSWKGFSLAPSVGVRETWYSARVSADAPGGVDNRGLHRSYLDLEIDVRTPVLERTFHRKGTGGIRHTIEPFFTWRRIYGVSRLDETIRFDAEDAIADTNELEYGMVHRLYRGAPAGEGGSAEILSLGLVQKYYFDPTFGGAFREGEANAFSPLDTATGFYRSTASANFAPLSATLQFTPRTGIHNDVRADFDTRRGNWSNVSVATEWRQGPVSLSGTYFYINPRGGAFLSGNHLQAQVEFGSRKRGFNSRLTASRNLQSGQWLNSNVRVGYAWNCCGLGLGFDQYDLGIRTESRLSFSFTLKGIGHFGNIREPEGIF